MRRLWLLGAVLLAASLAHVSAGAAQDKPYGVRGTLVAVDDQLLTLMNDDEETFEVALTTDTGVFAVTSAKWSDIRPGQFVGITSVESGAQRVALEVHIFAEDLRGTGEGHYPWDLIEQPNMMTNATVAEVEEVSSAERAVAPDLQGGRGRERGAGRAGHHGAGFRRGRAPRKERGSWPVRARQGRVRARPGQRAGSPGCGRGRGRRRRRDTSDVRPRGACLGE